MCAARQQGECTVRSSPFTHKHEKRQEVDGLAIAPLQLLLPLPEIIFHPHSSQLTLS
jgi:hypothetical protein